LTRLSQLKIKKYVILDFINQDLRHNYVRCLI
jgi:hypothetical protein